MRRGFAEYLLSVFLHVRNNMNILFIVAER